MFVLLAVAAAVPQASAEAEVTVLPERIITIPDAVERAIPPRVSDFGGSRPPRAGASRGDWSDVLYEDFESPFPQTNGWELFWNANSKYTWGSVNNRAGGGDFSAWCAALNGPEFPELEPGVDDYANNMQAFMIYGPFDLSEAADVAFEFSLWLEPAVEEGEINDILGFGRSSNGINFTFYFLLGDTGGWAAATEYFDESFLDPALGESEVWIAFIFQSNLSQTAEGAYLDDILIEMRGPMPLCFVEPEELDFGEVSVGTTAREVFTITNAGDGLLAGDILDCPLFNVVGETGYALGAGESADFTLEFAPDRAGVHTCFLDLGGDCFEYAAGGVGVANSPPQITHKPVSFANAASDLALSAGVLDPELDPLTVTLHYRQGGAGTFGEMPMTDTRDAYVASVPQSVLTSRGLEYYISASDDLLTSFSPADYEDHPYTVSVISSSLMRPASFSGGTEQSAYRMFSIPGYLEDSSAVGVAGDDFGAYDNRQWRLFRWSGGAFHEFPLAPAAQIAPRRAYWLLSRETRTLDTGTHASTPTDGAAVIDLQPGWNDIGIPYDFPVAWDDVTVLGTGVDGPYTYAGTWVGPFLIDDLEPWEGYSFLNNGSGVVQISIPPMAASRLAPSPSLGGDDGPLWSLRIEARCGEARDVHNYMGRALDASDGKDFRDHAEPRGIGGFVSLAFVGEDRDAAGWTSDYRPEDGDGDVWRIRVDTNIEGSPVSLRWEGEESRPEGLALLLLDPWSGLSLDMAGAATWELAGPFPREFAVVAGDGRFVEEASEGRLTGGVALLRPFPNPFRSETTMVFRLERAGGVVLRLYDAAGRERRRLVDGRLDAGLHAPRWDGRDDAGRRLPAGVYFYKLETAGGATARKVQLLR
jgi:hypothetical protein